MIIGDNVVFLFNELPNFKFNKLKSHLVFLFFQFFSTNGYRFVVSKIVDLLNSVLV